MKQIIISIIGTFLVLYFVLRFFGRHFMCSRIVSIICAVASPFFFMNYFDPESEQSIALSIVFLGLQVFSLLLWLGPGLFDTQVVRGKWVLYDDSDHWVPLESGGFLWNTLLIIGVYIGGMVIGVFACEALGLDGAEIFVIPALMIYANIADIIRDARG